MSFYTCKSTCLAVETTLNSQEAFTYASMRRVAEQSAQLLNQGCHLTCDGKGHCYEILHDGSVCSAAKLYGMEWNEMKELEWKSLKN